MAEEITRLLQNLREGDKEAESQLVVLVQDELHKIAARLMRGERQDHTLQPTALVNEAYMRLLAQPSTDWRDRAHFYGVAAQVMRHVLIDYARQRLSKKRFPGAVMLTLDEAVAVSPNRLEDLLALEDALSRLEAEDPRAAQVVVFRFFGGLSIEEVAEVMKVAPRTVKRDWTFARAWLKAELTAKSQYVPHQ